jgi:hypothetical protein
MKIALCFIISYNHILNKEEIWKKWIETNKDIINVYFYYKDLQKIKSTWILKHVIDPSYIQNTSYYHVIPAYLSLMSYALKHSSDNQWFCVLTESCCPIISPKKFRLLFYRNYQFSIMNWTKAYWNIQLHKRANLFLLPTFLHLANDPYFILTREDANYCLHFSYTQTKLFKIICDGGLANESLFAIILYLTKRLDKVKKNVTHLTDWTRMSSQTSPYLFKNGDRKDIQIIENGIKKNTFAIFIRKISPEFPENILNDYIYLRYKEEDNIYWFWVYIKYLFIIHLFLFLIFSLIHLFL